MAEPYVFISYSRHDGAFVARLADSLRAGVRTWTDVENIAPGASWQEEIEKGLLNASVTQDHARAFATLDRELKRKGL